MIQLPHHSLITKYIHMASSESNSDGGHNPCNSKRNERLAGLLIGLAYGALFSSALGIQYPRQTSTQVVNHPE